VDECTERSCSYGMSIRDSNPTPTQSAKALALVESTPVQLISWVVLGMLGPP